MAAGSHSVIVTLCLTFALILSVSGVESSKSLRRERYTALLSEEATVTEGTTLGTEKTDVDVITLDTSKSPVAADIYNITVLVKGPAGGARVRSRASRRIIEDKMGFQLKSRGRGETGRRGYANVHPKHIHSGDVLGILDLGDCDPIYMYATGSRLSRVAMALRAENGTLYVVEARGSIRKFAQGTLNPKSPAIMRTEYNEWLKHIDTEELAGLVWLPMAHELREIWDNKAANKYFESVEGLPFGYQSMAFAWLDTLRSNYGPPLSAPAMTTGAQALFDAYPEIAKDVFMQGMVNRLGVPKDTNFEGIVTAAAAKGYSLAQVATLPELDSYQYTTGIPPVDIADDAVDHESWKAAMQKEKHKLDRSDYPHRSLHDASLVVEIWKAGKIFGSLADKFQASEFTPRDVYQLGIFQHKWHRPEGCLLDNFAYCQLGGKFSIVLSGYNSVPPYENMNTLCPGVPPTYSRPSGC